MAIEIDLGSPDQPTYLGEDLLIPFRIERADGLPQDLTGWALTFTARDQLGDSQALVQKTTGSGITITDTAGGRGTITIARADTAALTPGDKYFDLSRTDAGQNGVLTSGRWPLRHRS